METLAKPTLATPEPRWFGGVLTLQWGDLRLDFERFTETRDGIACDLTAKVQSDGEKKGPLLCHGRHRLHQYSDKQGIIRRLGERSGKYPQFHGYPWGDLVELSCYIAIQSYRRGTPAIDIATIGSRPYPTWALHPYVQYGRPTVAVAPGGTIKTWTSCAAAATAISTQPIFGYSRMGGIPAQPQRTLFLDYESTEYQIAGRIQNICVGHNVTTSLDGYFFYKHLTRPLESCAKEIRKEIEELDIGFVVIDSLVYAVGGMLRDEQSVINLFMAVRDWTRTINGVVTPIPTFIVSHVSKESMGREVGDLRRVSPYGTVFSENAAGVVILFGAPDGQDVDEPHKLISVSCEKINDAKPFKPHAYEVEFVGIPGDPDEGLYSVEYRKANIYAIPEFAERLPMAVRVRELLGRRGAMRSSDVLNLLAPIFDDGSDPDPKPTPDEKKRQALVRSTLSNLKSRGQVALDAQSGTWRLLETRRRMD